MDNITKLYNHKSYIETYGGDVLITFILFLITFGITSYNTYQSLLLQIRTNWNENKCNPIYMPFAGIIMPQPGVSAMDTTIDNFSYCIKQDVSMVFSVAMLPLEFGMFIIIDFIDVIMETILAFMNLMKWLRDQIGGIAATIYNQIMYFIIPLVEISIHVRDALAKINGVAITSLYLTMNVYNTTVSGVLNIMNILTDLLIALISIIVAMIVFAFILFITPAFPLGLTLYTTATLVMVSILVPTIVLYTIMHVFTTTVFRGKAKNPPSIPGIRKR
jgi:hypothetical protein